MPRATAMLFTTEDMAALFLPEAHVQKMLTFEAALARAEARAGMIPVEASDAIEAVCRIELFDVDAIYREAAVAGTPAIPLVRMLTRHVADVGQSYVHWGATSQDAIDTALMLQMREGLDLLVESLLSVCSSCATLAETYRHTLMPGRTLLQQALPITFGLKAARWLDMSVRQVRALRECRLHQLALQFGGAAGTLAVLGEAGTRVAEFLVEELNLPLPNLPWHAERDRGATVASALGVAAGAMSKIAGDIVLLAQTEVGEAAEEPALGKGVSSALPQKRNPIDSTLAIAAARLAVGQVPVILSAMQQEHERAAGGWQAEWEAIPNLFCYTSGTLAHLSAALGGLQIDVQRVSENLFKSGGALMSESLMTALAPELGHQEAQRLVQAIGEQADKEGRTLREAALDNTQIRSILSPVAVEQALDPARYLGSADIFIDRALASYSAILAGDGA